MHSLWHGLGNLFGFCVDVYGCARRSFNFVYFFDLWICWRGSAHPQVEAKGWLSDLLESRFYLHLWFVVPFLPLEAGVVWTMVVETLCFVAVVMLGAGAAWYDVAVFGIVGVPTELIFLGTAENMFSLSVCKLKLQSAVFHPHGKTIPVDLVENIVFAQKTCGIRSGRLPTPRAPEFI